MKSVVLLISVSCLVGAAGWRSELERAQHLREDGQIAAADSIYREVIENAQNLNAAELNALGIELFRQSRYREAEQAYRRSLEEWARLGPKMTLSQSITAGNLGKLLHVEGRYAEAEPLLLEQLRLAEISAGPETAETARAAHDLAELYLGWGRPGKAEPLAEQADTILHALRGKGAEFVSNRRLLGSILLDERHYREGESLLREVLPELPEQSAVGTYNDLSVAEMGQEHLAEAQSLASQAVALARRGLPAQHPLLAVSLNNLAQSQRFQGQYLEAEKNYREAIEIWGQARGPRHPDLAKGLMNLAALYHERGREAGAEDLYRRATAIFEAALGKDDPLSLVARSELGDVLRAEHRYSEAEKLVRETLEPLTRSVGEQDPRVIRALKNYARLLDETRKTRQAAEVRGRIEGLAQGFRGQNP